MKVSIISKSTWFCISYDIFRETIVGLLTKSIWHSNDYVNTVWLIEYDFSILWSNWNEDYIVTWLINSNTDYHKYTQPRLFSLLYFYHHFYQLLMYYQWELFKIVNNPYSAIMLFHVKLSHPRSDTWAFLEVIKTSALYVLPIW